MTPLKKLILTSCAFLAVAVLLGALTAPYFRETERPPVTSHSISINPKV